MTKRRRPAQASAPAPAEAPAVPAATPTATPTPTTSAEVAALQGIPWARFGAGAGVAFSLLAFLASSSLAVGNIQLSDPSAEIAAKFVDARGRVSLGVILTLLSLFFLLVFVAFIHRWLRGLEDDDGWMSTLALGGGLLLVAMLLMVLLVPVAGTILDDYGGDPVIARTLMVLGRQALAVAFVPAAAFVGSVALVARSAGALPRWMTTTGLVLGGGMLVPPVAAYPYLFATLWIGIVAVTLLTRVSPRRIRRGPGFRTGRGGQ